MSTASQLDTDGYDMGPHGDGPFGDPVVADTEGPTGPYNLTVAVTSPTSFTVSWDALTDPSGVDGYTVLITRSDGAVVIDDVVAETSYPFSGAEPETSYTIEVVAFDTVGNVAETMGTISVTTPAEPADTPTIESIGSVIVVGGAAFVAYRYFKNNGGS